MIHRIWELSSTSTVPDRFGERWGSSTLPIQRYAHFAGLEKLLQRRKEMPSSIPTKPSILPTNDRFTPSPYPRAVAPSYMLKPSPLLFNSSSMEAHPYTQ
ncbi:hypothetical protein VNI00_014771 [Paramarasmius palmivorus]|uniref:Uncharacterized protein n=1 Tax=Paramarasmius palmivorus TaxID=297713 RepID=A0AAW0BRZ3_9AGAR